MKAKHLKNASRLIQDLEKDMESAETKEQKVSLRSLISKASSILSRIEKLPDPPPKAKEPEPDPEVSGIVDDLMDPL